MTHFLHSVLSQQFPHALQGENHNFSWQWQDEGVICLTPNHGYEKSIVLSAGIHGNETAPIELLEHIYQDVFQASLTLNVRLLLVLGNPNAIRTGQRYIEYDMNRMFCGGYQQLEPSVETQRAERLEQHVQIFFEQGCSTAKRYHYDLHTAIRASLLPTFALLPHLEYVHDPLLLNSLNAADLDAVVFHNTAGKTFSHFSGAYCQAASATLELGQAKPFGQNDLSQFVAIDRVLRALIADEALPSRHKTPIRRFKVIESILKKDDDFQLNLESSAPNFSLFHQGDVIATQQSQNYIAHEHEVRILFPNVNVAKGLRAGLILQEMSK